MEEVACEKCGAVYQLTEHKMAMRDKDTEECDFCGTRIWGWNGGCIWTKELVSPPTNPKYMSK